MKVTKSIVNGETEFTVSELTFRELDVILETMRATSYKPSGADIVSAELHEAVFQLGYQL